MTPEQFAETYDVSRETLTKLMAYQALLGKWQKSVNLVGPNTLAHFWQRHAADSAQIMRYAPSTSTTQNATARPPRMPPLLGLIWAAAAACPVWCWRLCWLKKTPPRICISSKAIAKRRAFLRAVIADTGLAATVHHARIEAVAAAKPPALAEIDVITARALAPLSRFIGAFGAVLQFIHSCAGS
jgi:16S rRNA (guanine527-N7)-methyltransferase